MKINNMDIIFFDGICNLCNSTVQFIIKRDKKNKFQFTSLQSNLGQSFLIENNLSITEFKSMILWRDNQIYTKSTAVLMILSDLDGYSFARIALYIPKFLRDILYTYISTKRYIFFGKSTNENSCLLPTKELNSKFIN